MKLLDYVNKVDEIIEKKNEEERRNALFNTNSAMAGLGFTSVMTSHIGNMSTITAMNSDGVSPYHVIENGPFTTIYD